jgi:hypothetical protein
VIVSQHVSVSISGQNVPILPIKRFIGPGLGREYRSQLYILCRNLWKTFDFSKSMHYPSERVMQLTSEEPAIM